MEPMQLELRGLRGSVAKVLLAFLLAGRALDVGELCEWTALERHAVASGLKDLRLLGLVGAQTLERGRQVFIPSGERLPGFGQMVENPPSPYLLTTAIEETELNPLQQYTSMVENPPTETEEVAANLAMCRRMGIAQPVAGELSRLEWVRPSYIEAHVLSLADWETRGLAVVRMRAGEAPPGLVRRDGAARMNRVERQLFGPRKYSEGPFSELILGKEED